MAIEAKDFTAAPKNGDNVKLGTTEVLVDGDDIVIRKVQLVETRLTREQIDGDVKRHEERIAALEEQKALSQAYLAEFDAVTTAVDARAAQAKGAQAIK